MEENISYEVEQEELRRDKMQVLVQNRRPLYDENTRAAVRREIGERLHLIFQRAL